MGKYMYLMLLAMVSVLPQRPFGQKSGADKGFPATEARFIGHWACESDKGAEMRQLIDIYKDGSLVIVHMHSTGAPGLPNFKYVTNTILNNKLVFSRGKETEMLFLNDEGNHIYYDGREFVKSAQPEK